MSTISLDAIICSCRWPYYGPYLWRTKKKVYSGKIIFWGHFGVLRNIRFLGHIQFPTRFNGNFRHFGILKTRLSSQRICLGQIIIFRNYEPQQLLWSSASFSTTRQWERNRLSMRIAISRERVENKKQTLVKSGMRG